MGNDYKREARKQYFHYFRFWFIAVGVLAVICALLWGQKMLKGSAVRANNSAPLERVYDYADVLTDQEEEELRQYIAAQEEKLQIDIVILTINQSVEGREAMEQYGYLSANWERNMQDIADDFWDENGFGYNKSFEGDGVILLHNWYEGQNGEHLSTSGRVEDRFGMREIDSVLDAVDRYYDTDPYRAYKAYVDRVCKLMGTSKSTSFPWISIPILPTIVAAIYASVNLTQKKAQNTTAVNTYVVGREARVNNTDDKFLRKTTSSRVIQSSGTRSAGGSGGGGGHHISSGGASHGGGSHRH